MPEGSTNAPLTPTECVNGAIHQVTLLMREGACEKCALKMTAHRLGLDYGRLLRLYLDQDLHE